MADRHLKIALVLNKDLVRCRGILRGILQYTNTRPDWILHTIASLSPSRLQLLRQWQPDGVIAEVLSVEDEATLIELGVPTVSVSNLFTGSRLPQVLVDQASIGRAAAMHFIERQFQNFAFLGPMSRFDSATQFEGFASAVHAAGGTMQPPGPIPSVASSDWSVLDRSMTEWLIALPKPCGLMLWDDDWGLWITQLCRVANLKVPDELALVGVNDDSLNCELAAPPLSSVGIPWQQIGHSAASLLAELITGADPSMAPKIIPHLALTTRPSSDILTIPDPDLVAAVRYIRANAHTRIGVEDVLKVVPVSRRILERKFRKLLNRTPLQEIRTTQVDLAKRLLSQTDLALKDIAARIGFDNVYHLCRSFKQHTSQTPMQHRRLFRVR